MTADGVLVPLRLRHATLAELVGASRPSVSTALAQLAREGILERRPEGWLLRGRPRNGVPPGLEPRQAAAGPASAGAFVDH